MLFVGRKILTNCFIYLWVYLNYSDGKMTSKINLDRGISTTWNIQVVNFSNTEKNKIECFLPEFSAMKTVTWKYHMDNSTEIRCGVILGV